MSASLHIGVLSSLAVLYTSAIHNIYSSKRCPKLCRMVERMHEDYSPDMGSTKRLKYQSHHISRPVL